MGAGLGGPARPRTTGAWRGREGGNRRRRRACFPPPCLATCVGIVQPPHMGGTPPGLSPYKYSAACAVLRARAAGHPWPYCQWLAAMAPYFHRMDDAIVEELPSIAGKPADGTGPSPWRPSAPTVSGRKLWLSKLPSPAVQAHPGMDGDMIPQHLARGVLVSLARRLRHMSPSRSIPSHPTGSAAGRGRVRVSRGAQGPGPRVRLEFSRTQGWRDGQRHTA